jgi:hypothetical protein
MTVKLISIQKSTKAGKKMMAVFDVDGKEKTIYFGASGYKDFTIYSKEDPKNADKKRTAYIARHRVNENWNDPLTPASLSRFVLWEEPTVSAGIRAYKKRFGF